MADMSDPKEGVSQGITYFKKFQIPIEDILEEIADSHIDDVRRFLREEQSEDSLFYRIGEELINRIMPKIQEFERRQRTMIDRREIGIYTTPLVVGIIAYCVNRTERTYNNFYDFIAKFTSI